LRFVKRSKLFNVSLGGQRNVTKVRPLSSAHVHPCTRRLSASLPYGRRGLALVTFASRFARAAKDELSAKRLIATSCRGISPGTSCPTGVAAPRVRGISYRYDPVERGVLFGEGRLEKCSLFLLMVIQCQRLLLE